MKTIYLLALLLWLSPVRTLAQMPPIAGRGPGVQISIGYNYFSLDMPSSKRINLSGPELGLTADFLPRLGGTIDVGYARTANVFGSGHHADALTFLAGPVFYPARYGRFSTYIRGLMGAAKVTGVAPVAGGGLLMGYAFRPSWAVGGGGEYRISRALALRAGADYVHTAFYNSSAALRGQDNVRAGASLVYSFGSRPRR